MQTETSQKISESPCKQELSRIWCELLDIETVNASDTFIDIGGDSLAAMVCIARIQKTFQVHLDLEEFFAKNATLETLAERITLLSQQA